MATWLHRLGRAAAGRPVAVLLLWAFIMAATAGAMTTLQKPLSNEFKIPDSEFGRVLDELGEQIPAVAGGSGTVVVHSPEGFTDAQRKALRATMDEWETLPHVTGTVDPFATQEQLDSSEGQLAKARAQLVRGQKKYDEGRAQLAYGEAYVAQGHPELQDEVDAGRAQLEKAGRKLEDGWLAYDQARHLRDAGSGIRFVSEDGRTALVQVRFDRSPQELGPEAVAAVPETGEALTDAGLEVDYGQELVMTREVGGIGEVIGVAVAGVVLLVMLGSLVLAGLPLGIALVGVGVSLMAGTAATHWVELQQMAPVLGMMLGLAVGIDYALFIVNRHRRQLVDLAARTGEVPTRDQVRQSIALATGTAGTAVVVAGATVVIALSALAVSGIPTLLQMGVLAAATVAITVLVALTLTPALLSLVGTHALPRHARRTPHAGARSGWPDRWVGLVASRPWTAVLLVSVLMAIIAIPATTIRLGLPDGSSESKESTAYQAYSRIADAFGPGANGPLLLAAEYDEPVAEDDLVGAQAAIAATVRSVDPRAGVLPIGMSEDHRTLAFQVMPAEGPAAESTVELVEGLRAVAAGEPVDGGGWLSLDQVIPDGDRTVPLPDGVSLGLTGATVANIEVSQRLADALPLYLALVIGLSLLLLTIVFRSLVVPLIATAGFLLSVAASFGAIVAVYQWGWFGSVFDVHDPSAVFSFMPTLLIGILFGLAMDYQMFLVSGMREAYVHGEDARGAVRSGFVSGARVVGAAALIMVSVFSGFIYSEMTMARSIGFGLAIGVLLDAFLVRMTLTPALMTLLGDKAWWIPRWLDRLLPDLDVEGAALVEELRHHRPAEQPADPALV